MTNRGPLLSEHPPQLLRPFAERSAAPPLKFSFRARRFRDRIDFSFVLAARVAADFHQLVIPEVREKSEHRRRDELWKNTCLEIFVAPQNESSYFELNLSPSGDWNIYAFDGYRSGMRPHAQAKAPFSAIERSPAQDVLTWHATLWEPGEGALALGASAVLELADGEREYWALAHRGEKPDFHLRENFCISL